MLTDFPLGKLPATPGSAPPIPATTAAAATTTAAVTATTAAAAATAKGTLLAGTSDIDGQLAPLEIPSVESVNRLLGIFIRCHLNETESAGFGRETIQQDIDGNHAGGCGEIILEIILGGVVA